MSRHRPQPFNQRHALLAAGTAVVPIGRVYGFDQIVQPHADMEGNRVAGKLVVLT